MSTPPDSQAKNLPAAGEKTDRTDGTPASPLWDQTTLDDFLEVSRFMAQVSTKLYGLKSAEEIFSTVVNEFSNTGKFLASIITLADDNKTGIMQYSSVGSGLIGKAEKVTGLSRNSSPISIKNSIHYRKIVEENAIICKPSTEMFMDVLPPVIRKMSSTLVRMLRIRDMSISAPVYCCGRIVAILGISSPGIVKELEDSIAVLTGHISSALEYAQQYRGREAAEQELRRALAEKEVMLREIHHRVKNNMQIISSMLSLQGNKLQNPDVAILLKEIRGRINSIASVHTELYKSDDLARIDMGEYFVKLVKHGSQLYYNEAAPPSITVLPSDIMMNVNQAIPCGLIVNELVTNALKHGYAGTDGKRPVITIDTSVQDNTLTLSVKDNGNGLPEGFNLETDARFGLEIIRTLAEHQLDGKLTLSGDGGLTATVSFTLQD